MMRRGQVALYLVMTLVAVTFLVLMNVGAYLGVTAKNRAMNAGDAAAIAVAKYQGELLNRIGALNIEHLKAAIENDEKRCEEISLEQMRVCFLDPIEGIRIGNEAARKNGAKSNNEMHELLERHVIDIRTVYAANPELYPEAWEGAWEEYAQHLEIAIGEGITAGPDNIDFVDAASGHYLINALFYHAIAGKNWCWFHFNAQGLLENYSSFRDWPPLPGASDEIRRRRCVNSEIYSLNLDMKVGSARELLGDELIMRLSGASLSDIENSYMITNKVQKWYFYDQSRWRTWEEMDPAGRWNFPVVGKVKDEYNVRGCAAICRVVYKAANMFGEGEAYSAEWAAAAKPFGTVEDFAGRLSPVTALNGFVTSAFTDVRLVPLDAVGGRDLSTADYGWMMHLREHLPLYLNSGPSAMPGCYYCAQLQAWERESLRAEARRWLKYNSGSCVRTVGGDSYSGGTPHGH